MPSGTSGSSGSSGSWSFSLRASFLTLFYLTLAFTTSVLAQGEDVQLRPSAASDSFPACGVNCEILGQADDACTPPTVPATNRQTYVSCFCQSALITGLKSNAQSVCGTCTSQSDSQKLQKWYVDFCNSGGKTGSNSGNSNSNNNDGNNNNNNDNNNDNSGSNDDSDTSASSSSSSNKSAPKSWLVFSRPIIVTASNKFQVGWPLEMDSYGHSPRWCIHNHRRRRSLAEATPRQKIPKSVPRGCERQQSIPKP